MRMTVFREKSAETAGLCKAMCEAALKFGPLHFDSVGVDDFGREYSYASLAAIKKATSRALCEAGIWVHADYGFHDDTRYISVTLEKDDQYVTSYLDIPHADTLQKRKAAQTQLRRAAIEGLLDLAAEQDTDARGVKDTGSAAVDEGSELAGDPLALLNAAKGWADTRRMASDAIVAAATVKTVESKIAKVKEKIKAGDMNPKDLADLERLAEVRIAEIEAAAKKAGVKPEPVGGAK
jgi:hypothetical protein